MVDKVCPLCNCELKAWINIDELMIYISMSHHLLKEKCDLIKRAKELENHNQELRTRLERFDFKEKQDLIERTKELENHNQELQARLEHFDHPKEAFPLLLKVATLILIEKIMLVVSEAFTLLLHLMMAVLVGLLLSEDCIVLSLASLELFATTYGFSFCTLMVALLIVVRPDLAVILFFGTLRSIYSGFIDYSRFNFMVDLRIVGLSGRNWNLACGLKNPRVSEAKSCWQKIKISQCRI